MKDQEYFTPEEIAEKFKVKKTTVYAWIRENKLRAIRIGKLARIPQDALDEFIKSAEKDSQ